MVNEMELSQFGLFKDLSTEFLSEISSICEERVFKKGEFIFREGEKAEKLFLFLDGELSIRVNLTSRPDHVTVAIINQPNQSFGWSGIVSPNYYSASAYCEQDCRLIVVPGDKLMSIMEKSPKNGFIVMRRISEIISSRLRNSRVALLKTI